MAMPENTSGIRGEREAREADMTFNLTQYIEELKAWQLETFGEEDRTEALVKHIRKELREIEAKPDDIDEWCDVMILSIEGAWRSGYEPIYIAHELSCADGGWPHLPTLAKIDGMLSHAGYIHDTFIAATRIAIRGALGQGFTLPQIQKALADKLATNKAREWPKWEDRFDGEPVEHIKK